MTREELAPARARESDDVLQVWGRRRQRTGDSGIERAAHEGQEQHGGDSGADLEAAVPDVLMRQAVTS
jgi:hypothetical protein